MEANSVVVSVVSVVIFIVVIVLLMIIRDRSGDRFEVRNPDIMLALILPVIILFATGSIQSFQFGDFKVESAFVNAAQAKVKTQVTELNTGLPVQAIKRNEKRGVNEIPQLIQAKTEVLSFTLGQGNYYGPAIDEYLRKLTATPYLKYILITEPDGSFWCLADANKLAAMNQNSSTRISYAKFARWLNTSDKEALQAALPGFLSVEDAVLQTSDKSEVLAKMEAKNVDQLPALDETGKFVGMVDRGRLLSSLILDVTAALSR